MAEIVIQVENLWKQYQLGVLSTGRLAHDLNRWWHRMRRRPDPYLRVDQAAPEREALAADELWALRDVAFAVRAGEVLGIIGRNGAGKSTLLKILSRVTAPTRGEVRLKGRLASLLEVGTGFHPDLTGRENIFLNGAILGMSKAEIRRKLEEIVAFAEIEKFMDTPVKRYSSGMYVRLAFAVAAHLEPEILLVDEVLAVGDAAFQKKCLGKMGEVARGGRTVLFVSHNMTAVRNLCSRCLWLADGQVRQLGETVAVVNAYLRQIQRAESLADAARLMQALPPDDAIRLEGIDLRQAGKTVELVLNGQALELEIRYTVLQRASGLRVYFDLLDDDQSILVRSFHDEHTEAVSCLEPGHYVSVAVVPGHLLAPRTYELVIRAGLHNVRACTGDGLRLPLVVEATSGINRAYPLDPIRSKIQPLIEWQTRRQSGL